MLYSDKNTENVCNMLLSTPQHSDITNFSFHFTLSQTHKSRLTMFQQICSLAFTWNSKNPKQKYEADWHDHDT